MNMPQPSRPDPFRFDLFEVFCACCVFFFLLFYINYAQNAWFFQDDFNFIKLYMHSPKVGDIFTFANLGRFISRNLYWWAGYRIFGDNAILFFFSQLVIVAVNAGLVGWFILNLCSNKIIAMTLGIVYFVSQPTISSFAWLSNSQHLLCHTFVFLFLTLLVIWYRENKWNLHRYLCIFGLFVIGINTNILFEFSLLPIVYLIWSENRRNAYSRLSILLMATMFLVAGYYSLRLRKYSVGSYSADFSLSTFWETLSWYSHNVFYVNPVVIIMATLILVTIILLRRKRESFFLILAFIAFYCPIGLAVFQRHDNYIALPMVFWIAAFCSGLSGNSTKGAIIREKILASLVICVTIFLSFGTVHFYVKHPRGKEVREFVEIITSMDFGKANKICFKAKDPVINRTGVKGLDIPAFWWWLGFGNAFDLYQYNDGIRREHILFEPSLCINQPVIEVETRGMKIVPSLVQK